MAPAITVRPAEYNGCMANALTEGLQFDADGFLIARSQCDDCEAQKKWLGRLRCRWRMQPYNLVSCTPAKNFA